jgi:hypothetical protein
MLRSAENPPLLLQDVLSASLLPDGEDGSPGELRDFLVNCHRQPVSSRAMLLPIVIPSE